MTCRFENGGGVGWVRGSRTKPLRREMDGELDLDLEDCAHGR